jgi:hypothetical protein
MSIRHVSSFQLIFISNSFFTDGGGFPIFGYVILAIIVAVFVAICIFICCKLCKNKKNKAQRKQLQRQYEQNRLLQGQSSQSMPVTPIGPPPPSMPPTPPPPPSSSFGQMHQPSPPLSG